MDSTAFEYAVLNRLQSDTTLRTLLGKNVAPYGVYRSGQKRPKPESTAGYPLLVVEFGEEQADELEASQYVEQMVTVTGWGNAELADIMVRVEKLLTDPRTPYTGTDLRVHHFRILTKGQLLPDEGSMAHFRPDIYLARYSLDAARIP